MIEDVTDSLAVIGIWGPEARAALAAVTDDDVSAEAIPFRTARTFASAARRCSRSGSRTSASSASSSTSRASGRCRSGTRSSPRRGPEPVGYHALDSLRLEKGYRYFGADITSLDTPFEAGLGFCVAPGKFPELDREPAQRLRTLVVGDGYVTVYGGEAVHAGGDVIGRVRSAGYGFTVERTIALAKLPADLAEGAEVAVDVFGELVPATVAADCLYDPTSARVRS